MARFSADIKERFFGSVRSTWSTVKNLTSFRPAVLPFDEAEMESAVSTRFLFLFFEKGIVPYRKDM